MKVSLIQLNANQNKIRNIDRACSLVKKAAKNGSEVILLPEVFNYRGPINNKELYNKIAEDIPGESINPLIDIAKENLASYQKPKSVKFIDALPKAPTGKILKRELRDPYWEDNNSKI